MEGADLWLAVAKRITLTHGGKVPLESRDGVGVTLRVALPGGG